MKILYIVNVRLPTEKAHGIQIVKTCEAFARAGNQVTLVIPARRSSVREDTFSYYRLERNFSIVRLPVIDTIRFGRIGFMFEAILFSLCAAVYVLTHRADIIFSRDEIVLYPISFLRRTFVLESHDGLWNAAARRVAPRAAVLFTVSGGLRDFYIEHGIDEKHVVVVPNGIDLGDFAHVETSADARRRLGLPLEKKIAMYIGQIDGWKGTDILFEASKHVPDQILLAVIGGTKDQVTDSSKRYPHIRFLGYRPYHELPNNQAAADVLVVPNSGKSELSVRFTSPLKLLAHMTSGHPIVASDLPSIRELAGDTVRYCTPDDPKALADAIVDMCNDNAAAAAFVQKARERVARFSWTERVNALMSRLKLLTG